MAVSVSANNAGRPPRLLHIVLSGLMALLAIVGFWPTYYGPLVQASLGQPPLIHVHALVFTGWLALFATQATLAASGRRGVHVRLGRIGAFYGVFLVIVGLTTAVMRSAALPRGGDAEVLLYVASLDMLIFASFFAAAIWKRRRPDVHRKLMTIAATTLLVAAVGRMTFIPETPAGSTAGFLIWSSPVLIAAVYDWRRTRTVHPIYVAGLAAFAFRFWSVPLSQTDAWSAFTTLVFRSVSSS